ncbi:MAG: winged helix-turn-helix transcriptional regulator [archaeon]
MNSESDWSKTQKLVLEIISNNKFSSANDLVESVNLEKGIPKTTLWRHLRKLRKKGIIEFGRN